MDKIQKDLILISYKVKFINEVLNDTIDLRKKKKAQICEILMNKEISLN